MPRASQTSSPAPAADLAPRAIALVERWLREAEGYPVDAAAGRLAGVLRDPNGLAFTVGFVDGVMRPEDLRVAGHNLAEVAPLAPRFLPWFLRAAIYLGGLLGPVIPGIVIPIARRVLRAMVGHLVLDASDDKLAAGIARLRREGNRLNLNLLGEAVLGEAEANHRLDGTYAFLARPDVDYVSIKVSSVVSQLSMWSFDDAVNRVTQKLTPLYELAASSPTPKFINLDMEEYRDLDLTIAVFKRILEQEQLTGLTAGIVLQTYLPDALAAMQDLQAWAAKRVNAGGAPIKVRVVKGANLAMERVDAIVHGWPLATVDSKQQADTNYKRVLNWALTPQRVRNLRIGVAGHNLFDIAYAWLLAQDRGVSEAVDIEMLLGMATAQAKAISAEVGQLLLYTPVVKPTEFDVAIAYLIRRLEENASSDNFMSAVFELATSRELFERERDRFVASLAALATEPALPKPKRSQNRRAEAALAETLAAPNAVVPLAAPPGPGPEIYGNDLTPGARAEAAFAHTPGFANTPDTDPALPANRAWGKEILARAGSSTLGLTASRAAVLKNPLELDAVLARALDAQAAWVARPADERAAVLHRAGHALAARRADLLEIMAFEAGKTLAEADPEVSEAIDFAHYYAERGRELDRVSGARFVPSRLIAVIPPWNFPAAIPAGGVLAALAAGSGVIFKPAKLTKRTGAVVAEALWSAGVPRDLLALVDLADPELGRVLVSDARIDRVILTGSYETAERFRGFRPDLGLLAETSGKNAIVVTPSADLDLAASDVIKSAFGHAGQKCSAASLVILVGSVARSARFERQLLDAARSLRVGDSLSANTQMGPIIEPASGKLRDGLTTLGEGESWLLQPRALDDTGRLWSPGIRTGVKPGSEYHRTEYFGPILGIMRADSLAQAIEWQNAVDYGLTAGLHSLDPVEIDQWLESVQAGNAYVNRGITGAIVQRQPFGGWKRSSVGAGHKAGGPNYLFGLGDWQPAPPAGEPSLSFAGLDSWVADALKAAEGAFAFDDFVALRAALVDDAIAFAAEYGAVHDHSGLGVERNVLRYRPTPVALRVAHDNSPADAVRAVAAALASKAYFSFSTAVAVPPAVERVLLARGVQPRLETDTEWIARIEREGAAGLANGQAQAPTRVRLASADRQWSVLLHRALGGSPDIAVWAHPLTGSGRVELLPYLREQAVSMTAHRFGNHLPAIDRVHL